MSAFLTPLDCRYVQPWAFSGVWTPNNGTDRWQLTAAFKYRSTLLKRTVEIPEGFRFDRATVPDLMSPNFAGRFTRSACVHDWLVDRIDRKLADRVFLEAMQTEIDEEIAAMKEAGIDDDDIADHRGALLGRAQVMYAAVYLNTKIKEMTKWA